MTRGLAEVTRNLMGYYEIKAANGDGKVFRFGTFTNKQKAQAVADFANTSRSYGSEFPTWLAFYQEPKEPLSKEWIR